MLNPLSWHIEPTSRCTLECPGCDRTWFKKTFKFQHIHDINVNHLIKFFEVNNFTNSEINLCGNNGDAIYHPNFIELITKLKSQNHTINLNTNGSAKKEKFWQEVCSILDTDDKITFAIDGLEDTNHLYRKNSNWDQIMTAIKIVVESPVKCIWKFIVFKHNQHQINQAKTLADKLNIDYFHLYKSFRWVDKSYHEFMPDKEFISDNYDDQLKIIDNEQNERFMVPYCKTNKLIYIDAEGNIYPCCESGSYRFKNKNVFGKNPINISQGKFTLSPTHKNFLSDTQEWQNAQLVCRLHCSKKTI